LAVAVAMAGGADVVVEVVIAGVAS